MTAPAPLTRRRALDLREARAFVLGGLARARAERAVLHLRMPAPPAPVDLPLRALRKAPGVRWRSEAGHDLVGHGAGVMLRAAGEARFEDLGRASDALFAAILRVTHADVDARAPRVFGGFAFRAGGADREPWAAFGDGALLLPRWSYEVRPGAGVLTLGVDCRDGWAGRDETVAAELSALWAALEAPACYPVGRPRLVRVEHADRARYDRAVGVLTRAIAAGELAKAVYSRRARVRAAHDLEPWQVLEDLAAAYPQTTAFGLRLGASTFLGATPERLFRKRGRTVEADALAGSVRPDADDADARLLGSDKDRREHRFVVDHLRARLTPLAQALEVPAAPSIRRLPNVLHLHTAVRGRLRPGVSPAEVTAALHPTPAVGGTPTERAVPWIAEHEASPRGWYAGPVGWWDADGNAEMRVALRCGVVRGATAWLYAGGGIVAGSEARAEWEESALKLRPLLAALGGSAADGEAAGRGARGVG
ncbi:MAG: isochorismate synthase MenF [Sandaracinaceae bacterium]